MNMKLVNKPDWDPNNPYHYHNAKGEKVVVTPEDSSFVSELDWSPESWFSKRVAKPDGTYYNADEAARLASHVPEYYNIEQTSKQNGTWLKMDDGSTWEGDPRAWVMMQSQAYRRNYSPKPWYTGQAEWPTQFDYPEDKKGAIKTNKVTRAPYYNGQMWFSNDKTYGDAFSYYYASTGEGMRQRIPEEANVSGHTFLSAIPKKGIYRKLAAPKPGTADVWNSMPYFLQNGHIYREKPSNISTTQDFRYAYNTRKDGKKVLTDNVVNWSRDLGDQGIFLHQINDGRGIKFSGNVIDILKRYSEGRNAKKRVKKSELQFTYPILEEFISQPGFTDKVKFIEGNTGDFDINNPYKYAENVFDNDSSQDTVHYAALGGHLYQAGGRKIPFKVWKAKMKAKYPNALSKTSYNEYLNTPYGIQRTLHIAAAKHNKGGKLKLIPKALHGMPVWFKPPILLPDPLGGLGAQAVNFTRNLEMLLAAKEEAARRELEEARLRLIRNQPQLRATTKEELERARRRTREYEIKQKANELAAIFGRALGAS